MGLICMSANDNLPSNRADTTIPEMRRSMFVISAKRYLSTVVFLVCLAGTAFTQDTGDKPKSLAQRLRPVTHLGLRINPQTSAYTATFYTSEDAKEIAKKQEDVRTDDSTTAAQIETLQRQLQEARASNTSQVEASQLMRDLAQAQRRMGGRSPQELLYRVVEVGTDFVELESIAEPGRIEIVPFHRIGRFVVRQPIESKPKTE